MKKHKSDDFSFNFDFSSLTMGAADDDEQIREIPRLSYEPVMYDNALDMAKHIEPGKSYFCFVPGNFIFGDLFEALCDVHKLTPSVMYAATLGMSAENIDSLVNCTRRQAAASTAAEENAEAARHGRAERHIFPTRILSFTDFKEV